MDVLLVRSDGIRQYLSQVPVRESRAAELGRLRWFQRTNGHAMKSITTAHLDAQCVRCGKIWNDIDHDRLSDGLVPGRGRVVVFDRR
jgi:hypothetical protein